MMFIYFGFILLIIQQTADGVVGASRTGLGLLLGALVIVSAWVLIYIYVRWAKQQL